MNIQGKLLHKVGSQVGNVGADVSVTAGNDFGELSAVIVADTLCRCNG